MRTTIIDGVVANTTSDWFSINQLGKGLIPASAHIISVGAMDATVSLEVSDEETPTDNGAVEIMSETVVGMKDISGKYLWYRAKVASWVAGTITVRVNA